MKKIIVGALFAASIVGGTAGVAAAEGCPESAPAGTSCSVEVKGTTIDAPEAAPAVAPAVAAQASLPVTGADTGMMAGAGLALILGGGVLVARSRKTADVAV